MKRNELIDKLKSVVDDEKSFNLKILWLEKLGVLFKYNNMACYSLLDNERDLINDLYEHYNTENEKSSIERSDEIAFLATELYESGGHTRLMIKLSSYLPSKAPLIVTRACKNDLKTKLLETFSKVEMMNFENKDLKEIIIHHAINFSQYSKLILNIHPEDIKAVLAVGLAKKINPQLKVFFVNHADHVFSFGASISDVWFEISSYGQKIDFKRNIHGKVSFLGIPIDISEKITTKTNIIDGDKFLASASAYKFKPLKNETIIPLIDMLLSKYPSSIMTVIGVRPLFDFWWWSSKIKFKKRLILKSSLPYQKYLSVAKNSSIIIDSHPLPGGTAFAEQILKGKKGIGLISPVQGYSPAELFKMKSINEILEGVDKFNFSEVMYMVKTVHSAENVKIRFLDAIYKDIYSENLCAKLIPWNGNAEFLEQDNIKRIPPSYSINSTFTWKVIAISPFLVLFKFLFEKIITQTLNLIRRVK